MKYMALAIEDNKIKIIGLSAKRTVLLNYTNKYLLAKIFVIDENIGENMQQWFIENGYNRDEANAIIRDVSTLVINKIIEIL